MPFIPFPPYFMHRVSISLKMENFLECDREISIDRERDFPSCRKRSDSLESGPCVTRVEIKIRVFEKCADSREGKRKEGRRNSFPTTRQEKKISLNGEKFWVI